MNDLEKHCEWSTRITPVSWEVEGQHLNGPMIYHAPSLIFDSFLENRDKWFSRSHRVIHILKEVLMEVQKIHTCWRKKFLSLELRCCEIRRARAERLFFSIVFPGTGQSNIPEFLHRKVFGYAEFEFAETIPWNLNFSTQSHNHLENVTRFRSDFCLPNFILQLVKNSEHRFENFRISRFERYIIRGISWVPSLFVLRSKMGSTASTVWTLNEAKMPAA